MNVYLCLMQHKVSFIKSLVNYLSTLVHFFIKKIGVLNLQRCKINEEHIKIYFNDIKILNMTNKFKYNEKEIIPQNKM